MALEDSSKTMTPLPSSRSSQRPGHSDGHPFAGRQRGDPRLGVDRHAQELEGLGDGRTVGRLVDATGEPVMRVAPDADVLPHGEVAHQAQVLVDEGEALLMQPAGMDRRAQVLPVDEDLPARVGPVDAADQLDQRGLAGSVLPHQGMDLAGFECEVGVLEDGDPGEGLREPPYVEPGHAAHAAASQSRRSRGIGIR